MASQRFPGPYLNETVEDDPMMVRRPPSHMEIAARPSTLRSTGDKTTTMNISHTGDQNALTRKGR
jgi:hypothetical protein